MATAKEVLAVAISQISYTEEGSYGSNDTLYGREYGLNYNPWCMMFIWWCFKKAGASELFYNGNKTASCPTYERWAKKVGNWHTSGFKPGDIVFMDFDGGTSDHVGIVETVRANGLDTIEGNTSLNGSQDNGGAVLRRYRSFSSGVIVGAYRPAYSATVYASPATSTTTTTASSSNTSSSTSTSTSEKGCFDLAKLPMLSKGDKGSSVKAMQLLLKGYGYSLGWYGADGDFGSYTEKALIKFQTAQKKKNSAFLVDGICGQQSWGALLGQ